MDHPGGAYEGLTVVRDGRADWKGEVRFVPEMLDRPLRWTRPRRIFVNSMSDLFHPSLTNHEVAAVFGVMAAARRHTFLVLTKRSERMRQWFSWASRMVGTNVSTGERSAMETLPWLTCQMATSRYMKWTIRDLAGYQTKWPLPNVWLGVTMESQEHEDRVQDLLATPAAKHWVSLEPLLERVDVGPWLRKPNPGADSLDWVVVGGESGSRARPFDTAWARDVMQQSHLAHVPVFVKQLGARVHSDGISGPGQHWPECERVDIGGGWQMRLRDRKGGDPAEWPEDLRVQEFPL
jgi:protein gp37